MAEAINPATPATVHIQNEESSYCEFHEYRWDLDKDFLGGLVLALGGYRSLAQTASQADIVMHSRIFYYSRIRGITIPYTGYRLWLRDQHQRDPANTRIWEWHLLHAICNHRDRIVPASNSPSPARVAEAAAAEQENWLRNLVHIGISTGTQDRGIAVNETSSGANASNDATTPAWMAAAPKGELYVDRQTTAGNDEGSGQVPYPEQFAAIIKAVQSGEQIEGIVEIPDTVARNPTTTPFGTMVRPLKPWEKAQAASDRTHIEAESSLQSSLDQSFPEQEDVVNSSS